MKEQQMGPRGDATPNPLQNGYGQSNLEGAQPSIALNLMLNHHLLKCIN